MALNKKHGPPMTIKPSQLKGPIKVTKKAVINHQGADAHAYGEKASLFNLATSTFHGTGQFYRDAGARDIELHELAMKVAVKDPDWMARFLPWLRNEANIRTSAITIAIDAAYAWLGQGIEGGRGLIDSVLQRADEPGEALAYAMATYGRKLPKPVMRGIADAASRLYTEFNWLKWDSVKDGFRFADVLELTHPSPILVNQGTLFKHIIDRRHNRDVKTLTISNALPMVHANAELRRHMLAGTAHGQGFLNPTTLKVAGMTWEDVLSGSPSLPKHDLWNALIPTMGYMALLRNLRNFEQAGIAAHRKGVWTPGILPERIKHVIDKLSSPEEVVKSRQLPFRFLSAYRAVQSDLFRQAINEGLELSLENVPGLPGRTLVLVDMSGSMFPGYGWSKKQVGDSDISLADQAKTFGSALALRSDSATLVAYGTESRVVPIPLGSGLLRLAESASFTNMGGTNTRQAISRHYDGHDRVFVITDEQASSGDVFRDVPEHVFKVTWNLAGYGQSHAAQAKNHVALGGLSDQMFKLIPILEARQRGEWPF